MDTRLNVRRECQKPSSKFFEPIGYDNINSVDFNEENPKKHYRKYYTDELENNKEIFSTQPFLNVPVHMVKINQKSGGIFSSIIGGYKEDDLSAA